MQTKIGILFPRSDMFPTLGKDIIDGFKQGVRSDSEEHNIQYCIEGVGMAADESVIRSAEKMLLQEDVDLTISFCSTHILDAMVQVFNANQKPLIHVGLGGNAIRKRHVNPYVGYHSLNIWQSGYAAGKHAAETHGKKAVVGASFYDGGYEHCLAFVQGFTENGGEIVEFYVAPMDYKSEDYGILKTKLSEAGADVAFLFFSFKEGDKVLRVLSESELNGNLPMVVIPLLTDESVYTEDHGLQDVTSVASWAFDDEHPAMQRFVAQIQEALGKDPNIIHLLGYEIGQVTCELLKEHDTIPTDISEKLKDLTMDSPRGSLTYNNYGESQVDSFKIRKFNFNEVRYHNTVVGTIDASLTEDLYSRFEEQDYGGWLNPYICT